jgi:hypothetical protein
MSKNKGLQKVPPSIFAVGVLESHSMTEPYRPAQKRTQEARTGGWDGVSPEVTGWI